MSANDYIRSILCNADLPARPPPRNSRGLRADSSHPSSYASNDHLYHGQTTLRPPPNMVRVRASRSNQRSPENLSSEVSIGGPGPSSSSRNTPSPSFSARNSSGNGNGETQPRRKKRPKPSTRLQPGESSAGPSAGPQNGTSVGNTPVTGRPGSTGIGTRPVTNRVRNEGIAAAQQPSGMASQAQRRVEPALAAGLRTRRMSVGIPLQPGPVDFSRGASMRRRNVQEDLNPINNQSGDSDLTSALPPPSYLDTISPNTVSRRVPIGSYSAIDPPAPEFTAIFDVPPPPISPQTPPQSRSILTINTPSTPPRSSVLTEPPTPSFPGAFPASPVRVISHHSADVPVDRQASPPGTDTCITTITPSSPPPSFEFSCIQTQNVQQSLTPSSVSRPASELRIVSVDERTTVERPPTPPSPQHSSTAESRSLWDRLADEGLTIEERLIIISNNATESLEARASSDMEENGNDDRSTSEVVISSEPIENSVAERTESIELPSTISHSAVVHSDTPELSQNSGTVAIDTSAAETVVPPTSVPYLSGLERELETQVNPRSASPNNNSVPLSEETSPVMSQIQANETSPRIPLSPTVESPGPLNNFINHHSVQSLDREHTPTDAPPIGLPLSHSPFHQDALIPAEIRTTPPPVSSYIEEDLHAIPSSLSPSSSSSPSSPSLLSSSESDSEQLDCQSYSSGDMGSSSRDSSRSLSPSVRPLEFHGQGGLAGEEEQGGRTPVEIFSSLVSLPPPSSLSSGGVERIHFDDDQISSNRLTQRPPPPVPHPLQSRPQQRPPPPAPPPRVPRRTSLHTPPAAASSSISLARLTNSSSVSLPILNPLRSTNYRPPPPPPPAERSSTTRRPPPPPPPPSLSRTRNQIIRTGSPPPPPLPLRPRPPSVPIRNESEDSLTFPVLRPTLEDRVLSGLSSLSSTSSEVSYDPSRRPSFRSDLCAQNEGSPEAIEDVLSQIQGPTEVGHFSGVNRGGREIGSLPSPERARPRGPRSPRSRPINLAPTVELESLHSQRSEIIPTESGVQRLEDSRVEEEHGDDPTEEIRGDEVREPVSVSLQSQAPVEFEYTDLDLLVMSLDGSRQYEAASALTSFLGPAHPKGLTTAQIDALPHGQVIELSRRTTSKGKTKVKLSCPAVGARRVGRCSFGCLGTLKAGEWVVGLVVCEHVGCEPCARSWLKEDARCPVCRKKVVA